MRLDDALALSLKAAQGEPGAVQALHDQYDREDAVRAAAQGKRLPAVVRRATARPSQAAPTEVIVPSAVREWLLGLGRKVEREDVERRPSLITAATVWLRRKASEDGQDLFEFLQDMMTALDNGPLTAGQAKGVLNCWRADLLREQASQATAKLPMIPSARYAVPKDPDNLDGDYDFISILESPSSHRQHVKVIIGGRPADYLGTIRPDNSYRGPAQDVVDTIRKDPERYALLFGQKIGRCCRCGTHLTDQVSRDRGIGPECVKKAW